jgi:hypothetical protein
MSCHCPLGWVPISVLSVDWEILLLNLHEAVSDLARQHWQGLSLWASVAVPFRYGS